MTPALLSCKVLEYLDALAFSGRNDKRLFYHPEPQHPQSFYVNKKIISNNVSVDIDIFGFEKWMEQVKRN